MMASYSQLNPSTLSCFILQKSSSVFCCSLNCERKSILKKEIVYIESMLCCSQLLFNLNPLKYETMCLKAK